MAGSSGDGQSWSLARFATWFRRAIEAEAGLADRPAPKPSRSQRPPPPPSAPPPAVSAALGAQGVEALEAKYGASTDGWPIPVATAGDGPAPAAVEHVALYVVDAPRHYVYVTRGLLRWRHPYELVLRVAVPDDQGEVGFATAPTWPTALLAAVGDAVRTRNKSIALGERLRELGVAGEAPYRHAVVVPDPELEWIEGERDEGLAFLQVVPLTDAQLAEMDEGSADGKNPALAAWAASDRLLLVPRASS